MWSAATCRRFGRVEIVIACQEDLKAATCRRFGRVEILIACQEDLNAATRRRTPKVRRNMTSTLNLQIITPEGTVYSEDVEMVGLRSVEGQIGILPHHLRLMTQMLPGEMIVRKNGRDQILAVGEGMVEVTG